MENSQFEAANLSAICTGQNEVFKLAGGGQQTCNNRFYTLRPYTSTLALGCFCKTGYLRNYLGQCVLPENCPAIGN